MTNNQDQEFVADELKRLVGWGAHPRRLAVLPHLRSLAGVDNEVPLITAGYVIRRFLVEKINALSGSYQFEGRSIEASHLKRAYRLLLQIDGTGQSAVNRRYRAITLLGIHFSIDQWRRPTGPERELFGILASEITNREPSLRN